MMPTLESNSWILISKNNMDYEVGDIVSFDSPDKIGEQYVKRIVGMADDVVEMKEGTLWVNDQFIMDYKDFDPRFRMENFSTKKLYFKGHIPENTLFVLGDNLSKSRDSRDFGLIHINDIRGRVIRSN